jgi:KDO2-lipid IV(A) lauroyltransferase
MGCGARLVYRLLTPLRERSEAQCGAALGDAVSPGEARRIAERSFIHRAWNLADLMLASRLLNANTFDRYGGRLGEPHLSRMLDAQRERRPVILISAYYGAFDLLPIFLGYNGLTATIVYLPHGNAGFDAFRKKVRAQSGCELIPVADASTRLGEVLERGGTIGLVADHHVEGRGRPATFLGLPTRAHPTVGLLAWRYRADVVVAGIRRAGEAFHFEPRVVDVIRPDDWENEADAVAYITERYLRAMERMILADPTQYLWGHARWGREFAQRAVLRNQLEKPESMSRRID